MCGRSPEAEGTDVRNWPKEGLERKEEGAMLSPRRSAINTGLVLACTLLVACLFSLDASARRSVPRGKCASSQRHAHRHGRHRLSSACSRRSSRHGAAARPAPNRSTDGGEASKAAAVPVAPAPLAIGGQVAASGGSAGEATPASGVEPAEPAAPGGGSTEGAPGGESKEGAPGGGSTEGAPGGGSEAPAEPEASFTTVANPPFRFFAPTSFWNTLVPSNAPLDPSSSEVMKDLNAELQHAKETGIGPKTTIETTSYSVPVYTVPANQPLVRVALNNPTSIPALVQAWSAVPLPANPKAAAGSDGFLTVWQPSTDKLWEFWRFGHGTEGWYAGFGGAMEKVSSNPGVYGPEAWPGARYGWGASSCSMSLLGGLITLEDLERGEINHAVMLSVAKARAGVYSLPARRTDGASTDPSSLPEGAHLRIEPKLDLASLHLPRLTFMIAQAAQRYGMFVCLRGTNVAFYGQDPTPTGTNPYAGPSGYFEGKPPEEILSSFPWNHVQLLKMELKAIS
jgi:hypothetical protein